MRRKKNPMVVSAAVIERDGRILIARRKQGWHEAGKWEFPGGTVEDGETPEECLKRELEEELDIIAEVGDLVCTSEHTYTPEWTIRLMTYRATVVSGDFNAKDHEEIRWVKARDLARYVFPEADKYVVERLMSGG